MFYRTLIASAFFAFFPVLIGAEAVPSIDRSSAVCRPGDKLILKATCPMTNGKTLNGWRFHAFYPYAQPGLERGKNVFFRKDDQQRYCCYIIGTGKDQSTWIPAPQRHLSTHEIPLDTTSWPEGDYQITLSLQYIEAGEKTTLYKLPFDLRIASPDVTRESESAWEKMEYSLPAGKKIQAGTRCRVTALRDGLKFEAECDEPLMSKLRLLPEFPKGSACIWEHDNMEFALCTDPKMGTMYKIMVDAGGNSAAGILTDDNTGDGTFRCDFTWNPDALVQVKQEKSGYRMTVFIPWGGITFPAGFDGNLKFNVGRTRRAGGKMECSSLSKLPGTAFDAPHSFRSLDMKKIDLRRFRWEAGKIVSSTGPGTVSVAVDLANRSETCQSVRAEAVLICREKQRCAPAQKLFVPASGFGNASFRFSVPENAGDGRFILKLYGLDGLLLYRTEKNIPTKYSPLSIRLDAPAYRNAIFSTMPDKKVRGEVVFAQNIPQDKVSVTARGEVRHSADFEFDAAKWPEGETEIVASAGKYTARTTVRKLPHKEGEIFLDRYGVPHCDGKRFLFFGYYHGSQLAPEQGYTGFLTYSRYQSMKEFTEKFAGRSLRNGQKGILYPYQEMNGKWEYKHFQQKFTNGNITEEQKKVLERFAGTALNQKSLFGWYIADEPEMRDRNPNWFEEIRICLDRIDPWHPTFIVNCTLEGIERYRNSADILMPDYYPDFYQTGTRQPIGGVAASVRTAAKYRPAWGVIQAFCWVPENLKDGSAGRAPDYTELRNQVYQIFAADGKGVLLYDFYDKSQMYPSLRLGTDALAAETAALSDYLLDPNVSGRLETEIMPKSAKFETALKILDGRLSVIAVNVSGEKASMNFKVRGWNGEKLYVAAENRSVSARSGMFSDTFKPFETHVYVSQVPPKMATTEEVIAKIDSFSRARFQRGNLMSVGDLNYREVISRHNGKIPAGAPAYKASSEQEEYYSKNTGRLIYLFDGIVESEPRDFHMCWQPAPADKTPVLSMTLPRRSRVGQVNIHAVSRYMAYGKVVTFPSLPGGRIFSVADGKRTKAGTFPAGLPRSLSVPFRPVEADSIVIEFDSPDFALSEVEVLGAAK